MKIVFSEDHILHFGKYELIGGSFVTPFECPQRMDYIMQQVEDTGLGEVIPPRDFDLDSIARVHDADYIEFMQTAHDKWKEIHGDTDALPIC